LHVHPSSQFSLYSQMDFLIKPGFICFELYFTKMAKFPQF